MSCGPMDSTVSTSSSSSSSNNNDAAFNSLFGELKNNTQPLTIEIVSDTVCPYCYIGKCHLEKALTLLHSSNPGKTIPVHINWLPFQLDPTAPADISVDKKQRLLTRFGTPRGTKIMETVLEAAKKDGLTVVYAGLTGSTINSHRLIEYCKRKDKQNEIVEALFKGYFAESKDINNIESLASIAESIGLAKEEILKFLKTDEYKDKIVNEIKWANEKGIAGVPHFIFNQKIEMSGSQTTDNFIQVFQKLGYNVNSNANPNDSQPVVNSC